MSSALDVASVPVASGSVEAARQVRLVLALEEL